MKGPVAKLKLREENIIVLLLYVIASFFIPTVMFCKNSQYKLYTVDYFTLLT